MTPFAELVDLFLGKVYVEKPVNIVFEDYGFGGKFFNTEVAEWVGAVKHQLKVRNIKCSVTFLAPNTVKKIVTGSGKAKDSEIKKAVENLFGDIVGTKHEIDALAIYHVFSLYLNGKLPKEVMRKIRGRTYNNV